MKKYPIVIDLLFIVFFVGIGRSAHRHGITFPGMMSTLWPFAAGLGTGWLVTWRRHHSGESPLDGLIIVLITVAMGMVLRVVAGQGTALAFIIVALAFLTLFLVGWRLITRTAGRRR
jgi:hypothetical protein